MITTIKSLKNHKGKSIGPDEDKDSPNQFK